MSHPMMTVTYPRWRTPDLDWPDAKTLPLLRLAVAAAPHRTDLKLQYARALLRTKAHAEIIDLLKPTAAEAGTEPELLFILGRAALAVGDERLAADALGAAAARGLTAVLGCLAEALYRLNRPDEALDAALRRLQDRPTDFEALQVVARVLFRRGETERLWRLCVDLRSKGAWGGWFSAVAVSAAATLGIEDEFNALCNLPQWFSTLQLATPDAFNQRLAAELLALRPSANAIRIDNLEHVGGPASRDLFVRLRQAVESYAAQHDSLPDHPINTHRPPYARLTGWAMLTEESKHHGWHIHQAGWVSGVYYVDVPQIECDRESLAGAIEFGPYPFAEDEEKLVPYRWHFKPKPGSLVLFPSYFAHRTWPTGSPYQRICIPFDVRPVRAPQGNK
jgi:tetratricopeptide (TPR) repeat protein